jgi:urease accessory protein
MLVRWSFLPVPSAILIALLVAGPLGADDFAANELNRPLYLSGLDQLLAVIALGVWAGRLGGHAPLVLPAAFVLGAGFGLALAAEGLPLLVFVRPIVWASTATLIFLAATATGATASRVHISEAAWLVGLFGVYHGHDLGAA